jgi:hypothetical protein
MPVVGEVLFASTWLLVIGLLNLFYGISVLAGSHIFITTAAWLVGDTRPEGWLWVIVSVLQLGAAGGLLLGRSWAIWIGALSVLGHIAAAIMFFSDEPGIAVALLLLDLIVLTCLVAVARSPRAVAA